MVVLIKTELNDDGTLSNIAKASSGHDDARRRSFSKLACPRIYLYSHSLHWLRVHVRTTPFWENRFYLVEDIRHDLGQINCPFSWKMF